MLALRIPSLQEMILVLVILLILAIVFTVADKLIGISEKWKALIYAVGAIFFVFWMIQLFGLI